VEIDQGVHWITGTQGCNVYLLVNDEGCCLIDAGFLGSFGYVCAYLRYLGIHPRRLRKILLTHSHLGHASNARLLASWSGALILGATPPKIRISNSVPIVDEVIGEGSTLPEHGIEVIATPGHSPDGLAYWLPKANILVTGDLLFSHRGRLLRPTIRTGPRDQHLNTLNRLSQLPVRMVLIGHGAPILEDGQAAIMAAMKDPGQTAGLGYLRILISDIIFGARSCR
jgi:glyoxylase-like metal-dependent hydrolase (beta-lactamase superfamily II)